MTLHNLARMTSATAGTGTLTLGSAVSGFLSFADAGVANAEVVTYAIRDGANSEIGSGTYTSAGTTLSRDTVYESTNGGAKINCSGSEEVFVTAAAEDLIRTYIPIMLFNSDADVNFNSMSSPDGEGIALFSSGAQNDEVTFNVYIPDGTYTVTVVHSKHNNRGIYHVYVAGVDVGNFDGYNGAGMALAANSITSIAIAGGSTAIKLKMEAKNASSSNYYGVVYQLYLKKTG